jgi:hypothetical protein
MGTVNYMTRSYLFKSHKDLADGINMLEFVTMFRARLRGLHFLLGPLRVARLGNRTKGVNGIMENAANLLVLAGSREELLPVLQALQTRCQPAPKTV